MPAQEQWRKSLLPRLTTARETLRAMDTDDLARWSGAIHRQGHLELSLFSTPYQVSLPGFEITRLDERPCSEKTEMLILDYLLGVKSERSSAPSQPNTQWIGFQELPDGAFYVKAFRTYTSDVLLRAWKGDIQRFHQAAERWGGESFSLGDAAYAFCALPKIRLAVVWWSGDDEFPADAHVLFDRASSQGLPIDGLAALGGLLCRGLLAAANGKLE